MINYEIIESFLNCRYKAYLKHTNLMILWWLSRLLGWYRNNENGNAKISVDAENW